MFYFYLDLWLINILMLYWSCVSECTALFDLINYAKAVACGTKLSNPSHDGTVILGSTYVNVVGGGECSDSWVIHCCTDNFMGITDEDWEKGGQNGHDYEQKDQQSRQKGAKTEIKKGQNWHKIMSIFSVRHSVSHVKGLQCHSYCW
jgi:hypothetical protein